MPMLYFRADSRDPIKDKIFEKGFFPRIDEGDDWWVKALMVEFLADSRGLEDRAIDAKLENTVCLTTNFLSAPIFPLANEEIKEEDVAYIYAIVLPDANHVTYKEKESAAFSERDDKNDINSSSLVNPSVILSIERDKNSPKDVKDIVVDLHSLQAKQVGNIVKHLTKEAKKTSTKIHSELGVAAGWSLYAYEAMAYRVRPENIVCAIQVTRKPEKNVIIKVNDGSKIAPPTRIFSVSSEILENKISVDKQKIECITGTETMDYVEQRKKAFDTFRQAIKQGEMETPNPYYGLGGKVLPTPASITFFELEEKITKKQKELNLGEPENKWLTELNSLIKSYREGEITGILLSRKMNDLYDIANKCTQESKIDPTPFKLISQTLEELSKSIPECKVVYSILEKSREDIIIMQQTEIAKKIPLEQKLEINKILALLSDQSDKKQTPESFMVIKMAKGFLIAV